MRLWKGIDEEHNGNFGITTLFIEAANPDINIIESVLNEHRDITALYFGAGEIDVQQFSFLKQLKSLKNQYNLVTLLEFGLDNIVSSDIRLCFDYVVLRIAVQDVVGNEQIKIRTNESVYIYPLKEFCSNTLIMLQDGQYANDVELYNKE